MANHTLIGRMLRAVDDYKAGRLSGVELEELIQSHMQGLERIAMRQIHESRSLSARLVVADCFAEEGEFYDVEPVSVVVAELRQFLRSLPDGQDADPGAATDPLP